MVGAPTSVAPWIAVSVPESYVVSLTESRDGEVTGGISEIKESLESCGSVLIGPGLVGGAALNRFSLQALERSGRAVVVLDADAMKVVVSHAPALKKHRGRIVVTPHAGEMASLLDISKDRVTARPMETALEFAAKFGAITVMKGSPTYIAHPDGRCFHCEAGNVGLGTSGSGDVLAGLIAGLAARGADALQAAVYGVQAHAVSGDLLARKVAPVGYLAREVLDVVAGVIDELCK